MRTIRYLLQELILNSNSLSQTKQLHANSIIHNLIYNSTPITSFLLLSYSKFNLINSSLLIFNSTPFPLRNSFLYNSLIRSLTNSKLYVQSLLTYNSMLHNGVEPDERTFPFTLKACADFQALYKGRELHSSIFKLGFLSDVFVGNTLLALYGSCGELKSARKVFDEMCVRDVISWNSIITVFSDNGFVLEALNWFKKLNESGFEVNSVSLVSVLPSCGASGSKEFGQGIHGYVLKVGLDCSVNVMNAIVDMYGKCGDSELSMKMFSGMISRSDASWNSIIANLVHLGCYEISIRVFKNMLLDHEVIPNSITIASILPALVELGWFALGKEIHGYCVRNAMHSDVYVCNSLVDMYAKCGCVDNSSKVFRRMDSKSVVSWNTMISNFMQNAAHLEAIKLVYEMQANGERPNSITFTNVLPACARIASIKKGKEIHALSIRDGSFMDLFVSNALIDMYAKCGHLDVARRVFDMSERDQVSYNTLIMGYSQTQHCTESLHLFIKMAMFGIQHDVVSFMGVLSACANISALMQGKEIHCFLIKKLFNTHIFVGNSLLDFYIKCGRIDISRKIFEAMPNKDVASWNAMILGYGMQGELETSIYLFDLMETEGVKCDHVSYIAILSVCSHGGFVERGKRYFQKMLDENIRPTQMHYACIIDLLGRGGLLHEAENAIADMPFEADSNVWGTLLGACKLHGNLEMGRRAADRLFVLKPEHHGYYALMSNMYAEVGRWEEAKEIRDMMRFKKAKNPGYSWVELGDTACEFMVGE